MRRDCFAPLAMTGRGFAMTERGLAMTERGVCFVPIASGLAMTDNDIKPFLMT